jgi:DNA-directed RNA polymerase subunit L
MFEITNYTKKNHLDLTIRDVDLSIVNGLRRVIMSQIPNVGFQFDPKNHDPIQSIQILQNDTSLHNEIMMHRLCLIPIHVSLKEIKDWNPKQYVFEIDQTNTKGDEMVEVTSQHINVIEVGSDGKETPRPELAKRWFPPDEITGDHILITKLNANKNNRFHTRMQAEVNIPTTHASFGVVSECFFYNTIDPEAAEKERQRIRDQHKDSPNEELETALKKFETMDIHRKFICNQFREPSSFQFVIHSETALRPHNLISEAFEIMVSQLLRISEVEQHEVIEEHEEAVFCLKVRDASHTEGNIVQSIIVNNLIRTQGKDVSDDLLNYKIKYIGYNVPHPLDNVLLIKICGEKIKTINDARQCFRLAVKYAAYHIRDDVADKWIKTYTKYKK